MSASATQHTPVAATAVATGHAHAIAIGRVVAVHDMADNADAYESCIVYTIRVHADLCHPQQDSEGTWSCLRGSSSSASSTATPSSADTVGEIIFLCNAVTAANARLIVAWNSVYTLVLEHCIPLPEIGMCVYRPSVVLNGGLSAIDAALDNISAQHAWMDRTMMSLEYNNYMLASVRNTVYTDSEPRHRHLQVACSIGVPLDIASTAENDLGALPRGSMCPVWAIRVSTDTVFMDHAWSHSADDIRDQLHCVYPIPPLPPPPPSRRRRHVHRPQGIMFFAPAALTALTTIMHIHKPGLPAVILRKQPLRLVEYTAYNIFSVCHDSHHHVSAQTADAMTALITAKAYVDLDQLIGAPAPSRSLTPTPTGAVTYTAVAADRCVLNMHPLLTTTAPCVLTHTITRSPSSAYTIGSTIDAVLMSTNGSIIGFVIMAHRKQIVCIDSTIVFHALDRLYQNIVNASGPRTASPRTGPCTLHRLSKTTVKKLWTGLATGPRISTTTTDAANTLSLHQTMTDHSIRSIGDYAVESASIRCLPLGYVSIPIGAPYVFQPRTTIELTVTCDPTQTTIEDQSCSDDRVLHAVVGDMHTSRKFPWSKLSASLPTDVRINARPAQHPSASSASSDNHDQSSAMMTAPAQQSEYDTLHFVQLSEERWNTFSHRFNLTTGRVAELLLQSNTDTPSQHDRKRIDPLFLLVPPYLRTAAPKNSRRLVIGGAMRNDGCGYVLVRAGDQQLSKISDFTTAFTALQTGAINTVGLRGCNGTIIELQRQLVNNLQYQWIVTSLASRSAC